MRSNAICLTKLPELPKHPAIRTMIKQSENWIFFVLVVMLVCAGKRS